MLTGDAWERFREDLDKDDTPPDCVHLGRWLPKGQTTPVTLYQLLPGRLSARGQYFPRPAKATMVEPGFHDAPGQDGKVAIVFLKFCEPALR